MIANHGKSATQTTARPTRSRSGPASGAGTSSLVPRLNLADSSDGDRDLLEALIQSDLFQEYERAFTEATGLPVALRPVESWQLPHHDKRNEGPFCAIMAEKSRTCGSCLEVQGKLLTAAANAPHTMTCPAGLTDTAVPIRLGDKLIGFLQTGQIFRRKPTQAQFSRTANLLARWHVDTDLQKLHKAYFSTRVVPGAQLESVVKLLTIFAQHLSILSNQILVQRKNSEPPVITRAKQFIHEHQTEHLRLGQVAKAVNTSTYYFCKLFKKETGLNFTDYLCRIRIEKARNLLLNPNLRVSEIAFEVGFQSLTHFNRVFKNTLGHSPTEYRSQLLGR